MMNSNSFNKTNNMNFFHNEANKEINNEYDNNINKMKKDDAIHNNTLNKEEKIKTNNENIINNTMQNTIGKEKNEKIDISPVEINPFMNPMTISNNDINNLF